MQVRTFQGNNTQEVLAQVKAEMGEDAVILGSREFRQNNKRVFEITAGIENEAHFANADTAKAKSSVATSENNSMPQGFQEWHKDWSRFKDHIYAIMQPALNWEKISPRQRVALEYLQSEGVENDVVVELYTKLTRPEFEGSLLAALTDTVPVESFDSFFWKQHIHIMLGPYGSGKTISALRLALMIKSKEADAKIAFINIDTGRGNGRLMLKHFAELSNFTYLEANDKKSFIENVKKTIDFDYVFIDFQALSKNETLMQRFEAYGLTSVKQNVSCHLCLSPHYSNAQFNAFIKQYSSELPMGILWTKLDESEQYGALVNFSARTKLPITALSFGSELNNTICAANPNLVWRILLKQQLPTKEDI